MVTMVWLAVLFSRVTLEKKDKNNLKINIFLKDLGLKKKKKNQKTKKQPKLFSKSFKIYLKKT
jgi:hypothetical protein